jgi:hypothetical protein
MKHHIVRLTVLLLLVFVPLGLSGITHTEENKVKTPVSNKHTELSVCFIDSVPYGFSLSDSVRIYGTSEKKQKDGSIFDYIDGGGIVYVNHGLVKTSHVIFEDSTGNTITLDVFDMGTNINAKAAFDDESICPSGSVIENTGIEYKTYLYKPDYLLYFHKSEYLVYLCADNDSLKDRVISLANEAASNIP